MILTKVIFRKWKDDGELIALFPELPADRHGYTCDSYQHIGQHGAASSSLASFTTPVSLEEAKPLFNELLSIGYELEVITRFSPALDRTRRANAKASISEFVI